MKTALVTGGNRGIGEGICRVLAERGYDIFSPIRVEYMMAKNSFVMRWKSRSISSKYL